ncbi:MAG: hypothetical protein K940chlam9_01217 [Chlamydiae bacterium]|nr:hypothetical protein [Chlamydiota bacterium]
MNWIGELVGFLIVFFVFLFPLFRKILIDKKAKAGEEFTSEEEELEEELEEEEELSPLPPPTKESHYETQRLVKRDYALESELEERELISSVEKRHLKSKVKPEFKERLVSDVFLLETPQKRKPKAHSIQELIKKKPPLQAMVILKEILDTPKGLE